jgi:hypothetical protein
MYGKAFMNCSKYQVYQAYLYGSDNMELPAKIKPKIVYAMDWVRAQCWSQDVLGI